MWKTYHIWGTVYTITHLSWVSALPGSLRVLCLGANGSIVEWYGVYNYIFNDDLFPNAYCVSQMTWNGDQSNYNLPLWPLPLFAYQRYPPFDCGGWRCIKHRSPLNSCMLVCVGVYANVCASCVALIETVIICLLMYVYVPFVIGNDSLRTRSYYVV